MCKISDNLQVIIAKNPLVPFRRKGIFMGYGVSVDYTVQVS